jgi:hypothetical protein
MRFGDLDVTDVPHGEQNADDVVTQKGAYGIRTYPQIGSFFIRGLHRGLHRLRLSVPVRLEIGRYAPAHRRLAP